MRFEEVRARARIRRLQLLSICFLVSQSHTHSGISEHIEAQPNVRRLWDARLRHTFMTPWRRQIQRVVNDPSAPVLPWLAPRVFQPWPNRSRALSTTPLQSDGGEREIPPAVQSRVNTTPEAEARPRRKRVFSSARYRDGARAEEGSQRDPMIRWIDPDNKPMYKIKNGPFVSQAEEKAAQRLQQEDERLVKASASRAATESAWYQAILEADDTAPMLDPSSARQKGTLERIRRRKKFWAWKSAIARLQAASRMRSLGPATMMVSLELDDGSNENSLQPIAEDNLADPKWAYELASIKDELLAGKAIKDAADPPRRATTYSAHVQAWYVDFTASDEPSANWSRMRDRLTNHAHPERNVRRAWQETLCYVVSHSPENLLTFLERTSPIEALPRTLLSHAFDCLVLWTERHAPNDSTHWVRVSDVLGKLTSSGDRIWMSGQSLAIILQNLPVNSLPGYLRDWQKSGVLITGNTVLQAAYLSSKKGQPNQAMNILNQHIELVTRTTSQKALQSVLASVLRVGSTLDDGLHACQQTVTRMVERGVQLNLQLCNIIMLNAVEANDTNTVFNVYDMLVRNGTKPDKYTFSILAKACKSSNTEEQQVARVIDDALRSGTLLDEPVVAGEILHALYQHHISKRRKDAFRLIIEAYGQLFDTAALDQLELPTQGTSRTSSGPLQASSAVIGIVVEAYLKSTEPLPQEALALYRRIVHLADEKTQPFTEMLQTDHVLTAFMAYFGSSSATVSTAIDILRARNGRTTNEQSATDLTAFSAREAEFEGLSRAALGVLQVMLAKHSNPSNSYLASSKRILDHMLNELVEVEPRNLMEMTSAYLRHGDAKGALRCIDKMVEMNVWDEAKGSGIRRMIANVQSDS